MKNTLFPILKRCFLQIIMLLCCYFISRCVFTLINIRYFDKLTLKIFLQIAFHALRYDISAIALINSIYFLLILFPLPIWKLPKWEKITQIVFIVINIIPLMFEISDWAYFPYNLKRASSGVLGMIFRKGDFWSLLPDFLKDFWYIPLAAIVFIYLFIKLNKRICKATPITFPPKYSISIFLLQSLSLLLTLGLCLLGFRGGLQYVPISIKNAVEDTEPAFTPIIINTPFSIITTVTYNEIAEAHYFPEKELGKYFNTTKYYASDEGFTPKNVVVIIIESYSKSFTKLGGGKSYTPFLDSLMDHSLTCTLAYANALHSQEAIPAIISGIPYMMDDPVNTSVYATDHFTSLPSVLKLKGYSSAFYHGGTNGTMSFDVYAAGAGYDAYKGRTEYNNENDYDGNWGIWDEPFLQYFVSDISKMKQPFFASVFTLSSHEPFHIPDIYQGKFPNDSLPIHQAVAYTDYSLRKFFETASLRPWYRNTLFVITADHCFPLLADTTSAINMASYAIPIIYFAPGDTTLKGYCDTLTQEIDILPSVLDYLDYDKPFFAFGNSIFRNASPRYTANYLTGFYQFVMDGHTLQCVNMQPKGLYNFPADMLCHNNLLPGENNKVQMPLNYLKAFMQLYNNSLIRNKMWVSDNK